VNALGMPQSPGVLPSGATGCGTVLRWPGVVCRERVNGGNVRAGEASAASGIVSRWRAYRTLCSWVFVCLGAQPSARVASR
jgi:hypothetical protein